MNKLEVKLNMIGLPTTYTLTNSFTGLRLEQNEKHLNDMLLFHNQDIEAVARELNSELLVIFEQEEI